MSGEIDDREDAIERAREYADEECLGELGEILDVTREDDVWLVEFRTHTFSDEYDHRVRVSSVGNVFAHDRSTQSG